MAATLNELMNKRDRMNIALKAIEECEADLRKFGNEGVTAAGWAAGWAAVMMATDIIKIGWSAGDKRAAAGFSLIDNGIQQADKLLQFFGSRPMTKKEDLLAQVDPSLQDGVKVIGYLREAKGLFGKLKDQIKTSPETANSLKAYGLVADIALAMADDTILMIDAGKQQSRVQQQTALAVNRNRQTQAKMRQDVRRLNDQINYMIAEIGRYQRTA